MLIDCLGWIVVQVICQFILLNYDCIMPLSLSNHIGSALQAAKPYKCNNIASRATLGTLWGFWRHLQSSDILKSRPFSWNWQTEKIYKLRNWDDTEQEYWDYTYLNLILLIFKVGSVIQGMRKTVWWNSYYWQSFLKRLQGKWLICLHPAIKNITWFLGIREIKKWSKFYPFW